MYAKKIIWCVNGYESCCAEVIVSDGHYEIVCFLDNSGFENCWLKEGQEILEPIAPLNSIDTMQCPICRKKHINDNPMLLKYSQLDVYDNEIYETKMISSPYEYHLTGKIINTTEGMISIGGIIINGFGLPDYCKEGKFITVHYSRLDILKP